MDRFPSGLVHQYGKELQFIQRLFDLLIVSVALYVITMIHGVLWTDQYTALCLACSVAFLISGELAHLYTSYRTSDLLAQIPPILLSWFCTLFLLLLLGYAFKITAEYSRLALGFWFTLTPMLLFLSRAALYSLLRRIRRNGRNSRKAVIVGTGGPAARLAENIQQMPWSGLRLEGYIDPYSNTPRNEILGDLETLYRLRDLNAIDIIFIAVPIQEDALIAEIMDNFYSSSVAIYLVPDLDIYGIAQGRWVILGDAPTVAVADTPIFGSSAILKRLEDIIFSSIALILTAPLMVIISIAIKLDTPGPILFIQKRHGFRAKEIRVLKFRTMSVMENGLEIRQATRNDARITRVGSILRRTSLDELPQFFNVLAGSMSVVGPRPHALAHNHQFQKSIWGYMRRHILKPGLTGLAQINGLRGETDTLEKMESRIKYDIEYINTWSLWLDLKIVLITPFALFKSDNAY